MKLNLRETGCKNVQWTVLCYDFAFRFSGAESLGSVIRETDSLVSNYFFC
jgi:hypothetical protein